MFKLREINIRFSLFISADMFAFSNIFIATKMPYFFDKIEK